MNEYIKQADDFLIATNTILNIKFLKYDYHFKSDKEKRLIYEFELKRGSRSYCSNFGSSLADIYKIFNINSYGKIYLIDKNKIEKSLKTLNNGIFKLYKDPEKNYPFEKIDLNNSFLPTSYDILTCLQKYEVSKSIDDFCAEYDYNLENSKISDILESHASCLKEYENLKMMYSDQELELLQNIN